MRELIEEHLGYVNHFGDDAPILSLVTHRRTFDHDWERRYQLRRIIRLKLPKTLNMSAIDIYTKLPNGLYMDIIEDIVNTIPEEDALLAKMEEELDEMSK